MKFDKESFVNLSQIYVNFTAYNASEGGDEILLTFSFVENIPNYESVAMRFLVEVFLNDIHADKMIQLERHFSTHKHFRLLYISTIRCAEKWISGC